MGYQASVYQSVTQELDRRRNLAVSTSDERRAELHALSQEIREIDNVLAGTAMRIFRAALGGADCGETFEQIQKESQHLLEVRGTLLEALGYPKDYTEPHYTCPHCQDTGYVMAKMCACMKQLLAWEALRQSGVGKQMDTQTFDSFSLDYYTANADALQRMKGNVQEARRFADSFVPGESNLLLLGGTGLGKTHLSVAIARGVVEKGYSVVYVTAQELFDTFETEKFHSGYGERSNKRTDKYLDADLLIIDDLGTEHSTSFTVSCLYQIVNSRSVKGVSTVINTNLTQTELMEQYDKRLISRLVGLYHILFFPAVEDIRIRKMMENR